MSLFLIPLLWLTGGSAWAGPEVDLPQKIIEEMEVLSNGDAQDRDIWLAEVRAEARRRFAAASESADRSGRVQRSCHQERADEARTVLSRIDELRPALIHPDGSLPVRRAALLAIAQAYHPMSMVDAAAPCAVSGSASSRTWSGPRSRSMSPIHRDDPLTLGFERPGRRALKPW